MRVHFQVIEGTRKRTQVFEGVVLRRQGSGARETFTVRKQSFGVGVERTFPLHSPKIEKLEVAARGDVRRAKLYYLRGRSARRPASPSGAGGSTRTWSRRRAAAEATDAEGVTPGGGRAVEARRGAPTAEAATRRRRRAEPTEAEAPRPRPRAAAEDGRAGAGGGGRD